MTQSFAQDRKRLDRRHHRMDAELQARARPYSLVRKDPVQEIREFVEKQAEDQQLDRRIIPNLVGGNGDDSSSSSDGSGGNGSQRGSGDSGSSRGGEGNSGGSSSSSSRGGDSGSIGGTGSNSGNSGNFGTGNGAGSGANDETSSSSSSSSSSTSTKTKGIIASLESELHHSSTTSSSSSSSSTSTSTRTTSSSTPTSTSTSPTTTSSITPSTSVAFVTPTAATPTLNNAAASASPSDTSSSGPGAGLIIGIVAGALAGIAVLAALIGFLIKKFAKKDDPFDNNPFDSNEFRRQSAMLPDNFDDIDHNPEMSEINHHNNMSPFNDEMEYAAAGGVAGAGAVAAFNARNESGGPRPPTMFQNHMNAPAAQYNGADAPPAPVIGSVFNPHGAEPTPQLPPMAFGGSDPYSMAGVGRSNFDNNLNNPYGYLNRQYSGSRSSPQDQFVDARQGYANLDRTGSEGSTHAKSAGQMYSVPENDDYRSYDHHDTAGRPGTAEGRSGTPDLPNVQQTYAMDRENDDRAQSPNRQMAASPAHLSQDFLSNGKHHQYNHDQYDNYQHSESPSPPSQPLQVRNLLPNPHLAAQQHRPTSGVSSVADDEAAYGGVW